MTDREKAIVMAYTGHTAYTHEVFSKDISERAKNDFIKLCKEEDEYRWHDLRKEPEDLPQYNHDVLVCCENEQLVRAYFVMWVSKTHGWLFQAKHPCCNIIAWKEIEGLEVSPDGEIH